MGDEKRKVKVAGESLPGTVRHEYEIEIEVDRIRHKLVPIADLLAYHNKPIVDGDMCAEAITGLGYILQEITEDLKVLDGRLAEMFREQR